MNTIVNNNDYGEKNNNDAYNDNDDDEILHKLQWFAIDSEKS